MKQDENVRFVGVTGLPGAGKGAFVDLLRPLLEQQGIATRYYSLSDELRDEARRRGRAVERPILRAIANELRLQHGAGVLSLLVTRKIKQELEILQGVDNVVVIIDAIRNPEEVHVLRQELTPHFTLVGVEAPLEVLVNRIASRARFDEPDEFVQKREAARKMILGESGEGEPAHGHNIAECVAEADWRVDNSGTLQDLTAATRRFIENVILVPASKE